MGFRMHKVQVWSAEIEERPGAAAAKLEILARAGADLEFVFTRPIENAPHKTALFLAPIQGTDQLQAAHMAGLEPAREMAMLCLEGDNRPGIGYELMYRLAVAGINLPGMSISAVGNRFAAYLAFHNPDDVTLAIRLFADMAA
jgi:hypothetical protein